LARSKASNLIVVASREGALVCDLGRDQEMRHIERSAKLSNDWS
jgi:hypothetical protein